jgi:hypothetical protein
MSDAFDIDSSLRRLGGCLYNVCGRGDVAELGRLLPNSEDSAALRQGFKLVHFSAQLERFAWDRGCA